MRFPLHIAARYFGPRGLRVTAALMFNGIGIFSHAQLSFSSAVDLALRNDPRVKLAQDDLRRSIALAQEMRDVYIPSASANGGAGYSHGITLTVPTIFTLDAQSLLYSSSQRHYISSSRWAVEASRTNLLNAREQVEEDVAITYVTLDSMQRSEAAVEEADEHARALATIVEKRIGAGIESQMEWKQARRTAAQLRLQLLQMQDQQSDLQEHLGHLTGLTSVQLRTVAASVAEFHVPHSLELASNLKEALGTVAAEENARARREHARGDARSLWKPQVNFNAQYGRVSPINSVNDYYNLHGEYNVFFAGLSIHVPFLDAAAKARQREADADASHAVHELESVHTRQEEERRGIQHALAEASARMELAELDAGIAADQMHLMETEALKGGSGGPVMTPKDVARSRVLERQKYAEFLDAQLQWRRSQIFYLRQSGELQQWIDAARNPPTGKQVSAAQLPY